MGKLKSLKLATDQISAPNLSDKDIDALLAEGTMESKMELIAHNQLVIASVLSDILRKLK